jgi:CelD/BcsL family acetyltransferase involved in cellulose biosynthesis
MACRLALTAAYDRDTVAGEWQALERDACRSFFLSWTWISCWLDSLAAPPLLLRGWKEDRLAVMGFFAPAAGWHRLLPGRRLHLHQSGNADFDRIAVEFNGLLVREEDEPLLVPLALAHLRAQKWDVVLPGVPQCYQDYAGDAGYACITERAGADFLVDLEVLRRSGRDWIDTLSPNSRGQLRRAVRLAAADGPLTLEPAAGPDQALAIFGEMAALDQARRGRAGAFTSRARLAFHQRLIRRGAESGAVELLHARAGEQTLGYLYLFRHGRRLSVYQAAYPPAADNRHRPGLVMHSLAIARAMARGDALYDFLAGEARYKRSLGREGETLLWLRLQQPNLIWALERGARNLKDFIGSASARRLPA